MTDVGKTWAPVLLAGVLWVFAWVYAQLPPPGEAAGAIQVGIPPASSADLGAGDTGHRYTKAIAKHMENPTGDATASLARDDVNSAAGSRRDVQDLLSVEPDSPIDLTEDWQPITRTMPPLVRSASIRFGPSVPSGPGSVTISVFAAPHKPIDIWMLGPGRIGPAPAIGGATPGPDVWRVGPAFVVGEPAGPIVAATYVNNVTAGGGISGHGAAGGAAGGAAAFGLFTVNPSARYSFGDGWFVSSAPTFASDKLPDGPDWTLPVGAQLGRVIEINGKLPVNLLVGVYYDALRPQFGSRWQLRTAAAFVF